MMYTNMLKPTFQEKKKQNVWQEEDRLFIWNVLQQGIYSISKQHHHFSDNKRSLPTLPW